MIAWARTVSRDEELFSVLEIELFGSSDNIQQLSFFKLVITCMSCVCHMIVISIYCLVDLQSILQIIL